MVVQGGVTILFEHLFSFKETRFRIRIWSRSPGGLPAVVAVFISEYESPVAVKMLSYHMMNFLFPSTTLDSVCNKLPFSSTC